MISTTEQRYVWTSLSLLVSLAMPGCMTAAADPLSAQGSDKASDEPSQTTSSEVVTAATGWVIHNGESGFCLGIHAGSTSSGEDAVVGSCTGDPSQTWFAIATTTISGLVYHQFQNAHSGLCLGVHSGSSSGGAHIVQGPCSGTSDHSQFWRNNFLTSDFYEFINGHSGLCMGIHDSNITGFVVQGSCVGSPTQTWFSSTAP